MLLSGRLKYAKCRTQRQAEIGAGIAVGNREDIDFIEKRLIRDNAVDT